MREEVLTRSRIRSIIHSLVVPIDINIREIELAYRGAVMGCAHCCSMPEVAEKYLLANTSLEYSKMPARIKAGISCFFTDM